MKDIIKYTFKYMGALMLATILFNACDPAEDRTDISGIVDKSALKYTYKQLDAASLTETTGGNLLALSLTSTANVVWRAYANSNNALIAMGNDKVDTLDLSFEGTYKIVVYAAFKDGAVLDSFNVKTTAANPKTFSDPIWNYLTNGVNGKYWKFFKASLGPVNWESGSSMWANDIGVEWGSAWAKPNPNDSCYFDLNGGFNFKHFNNESVGTGRFTLNLTTRDLAIIGSDNLSMSIRDGSGEMADANKSKYRLYYVSNDTLIVGQGAYYTSDRPTQTWGYFHWYLKSK